MTPSRFLFVFFRKMLSSAAHVSIVESGAGCPISPLSYPERTVFSRIMEHTSSMSGLSRKMSSNLGTKDSTLSPVHSSLFGSHEIPQLHTFWRVTTLTVNTWLRLTSLTVKVVSCLESMTKSHATRGMATISEIGANCFCLLRYILP